MKKAMKSYDPAELGAGHSRGELATPKAPSIKTTENWKKQTETLDELSHLGTKLSHAQRRDVSWWKEQWDSKMLEENQGDWGQLFA